MSLFDIIPVIMTPPESTYPEPLGWKEVTRVTTVSEAELPPAIREKLARKSSEYNFSESVDDDTSVQERKVSEAFVREQARKFNRKIKRG